jgi:hypothetical protein
MSDPVTPLTPAETAAVKAQVVKEGYVHRTLVGFDQFVNVAADGLPDETISARSARAAERGSFWGKAMSRFLNLFQKNHGPQAVAGDLERAEAVEKTEKTSGLVE